MLPSETCAYKCAHLTECLAVNAAVCMWLPPVLAVHQGNSIVGEIEAVTRIRLQTELHALTSAGGPRYPPVSVRRAAKSSLDGLFPKGRTMRTIVAFGFGLIHPTDWPFSRTVAAAVSSSAQASIRCWWTCLRQIKNMWAEFIRALFSSLRWIIAA